MVKHCGICFKQIVFDYIINYMENEAYYYSAFHEMFDKRFFEVCLKFLWFAANLAILSRTCQSNSELGNKVVNFTSICWGVKNFVASEVHAIQCSFHVSKFP